MKLRLENMFCIFQEHFLKLKIENAMGSATPTDKQVKIHVEWTC
jgi:hypothetical protein